MRTIKPDNLYEQPSLKMPTLSSHTTIVDVDVASAIEYSCFFDPDNIMHISNFYFDGSVLKIGNSSKLIVTVESVLNVLTSTGNSRGD